MIGYSPIHAELFKGRTSEDLTKAVLALLDNCDQADFHKGGKLDTQAIRTILASRLDVQEANS